MKVSSFFLVLSLTYISHFAENRDYMIGCLISISKMTKLEKKNVLIDLELILKVIENRGYMRSPLIPSMNKLIYEKVKHLYVDSKQRGSNS